MGGEGGLKDEDTGNDKAFPCQLAAPWMIICSVLNKMSFPGVARWNEYKADSEASWHTRVGDGDISAFGNQGRRLLFAGLYAIVSTQVEQRFPNEISVLSERGGSLTNVPTFFLKWDNGFVLTVGDNIFGYFQI